MHFVKTTLLALLGLGAVAFAAPIENVNAAVAGVQDGCNNAYRGEYRACERGRDQKHDGRREEQRGVREIQNGNISQGLRDIERGQRDQARGAAKECRAGGRCSY